LRKAISVAALLALLIATSRAFAYEPTVADLDANSRAAGNQRAVAVEIGKAIFAREWPAQVSQISANGFDDHVVVGVRLWGVKFHRPLTQEQFVAEVTALVEKAFSAAPRAEEVDLWASVPLKVGKGEIVSGDLAQPTARTVFSVTVRRGESTSALSTRIQRGDGIFWDPSWAHEAFVRVS
jgi:hypothetical protein